MTCHLAAFVNMRMFTKSVNYKTYRLERSSARYNSTIARYIKTYWKNWTCT